jgi:tetratricopeptide (TPR) repeat protein
MVGLQTHYWTITLDDKMKRNDSLSRGMMIWLLIWPFWLGAQTVKPKPEPATTKSIVPISTDAPARTDVATWAVVIGISDYQDPDIPDLRFADADAEAFAAYLQSPAGGSLDQAHLTLLINEQATAGRVANALESLLEKVKEEDHVIIYFSGHGDVERNKVSQPGFLLCWDSPSKVYMGGGTYSLAYLHEIIITLAIQKLAKIKVITDACHAGKLSGSQIGGAQLTASNMAKQFANEVKILSCLPNEFSLEGGQWGGGRGCFSYHLVEGLYGLADRNADGVVSVSEIDRYLEDHVTPEAAPHPQSPMVVGVKSDKLAYVDAAILTQLKKYKQGELPRFSPTEGRVFEENLLTGFSPVAIETKVDSGVWGVYHQFKLAIQEKRLLEPANDCAEYYFNQLTSNEAIAPLHGFIRRNYAAALQDDAQQAVNAILRTSVQEVTESAIKKLKKYERFPVLLARSAELLGPEHYMYNTLKARQLTFEGLLTYFETRAAKDTGSVNKVLSKYYQSLAYQWESPITHYYMSLCFAHQAKMPDSALVHARIATELVQTWVLPYAHLAYYFSKDYKRYKDAEMLIQEALKIDSNSTVVWMAAGSLYHYQFKFPEAAQAYKKVLELDASNVLARISLAVGLIEMAQYQEAESNLQQIINSKPDHFYANYSLGCMYDRLGREAEAEPLYLRAIKTNPLHVFTHDSLAIIYQNQGRVKEAVAMNEAVTKLNPNHSEAWYRLGSLAAMEKDPEKAVVLLEKAIESGLKNPGRIKNDPAFDPIRTSNHFVKFLKKVFPLDDRE